MNDRTPTHRLESVDALRGLAALAVCWFHFTQGNGGFLPPGWLKSTGHFGYLGVEVFFVLSGFVIPYAMRRGNYRGPRDLGRFLVKRVVRIEPPYLANIAMVLALGWLSTQVPGFRGPPLNVSSTDVLLHLGYLNSYFDRPWLNVVYWTLAIEFQYYLLVALIHPLLSIAGWRGVLFALAINLPAGLLEKPAIFWSSCPLFCLGVLAFQRKSELISWRQFGVGLALGGALAAALISPPIAVLGGLICLCLVGPSWQPPRFLIALGAISYSLYLVHVPVGGRVINLGARLPDRLDIHLLTLISALGISLLTAWVMWRLVELPCQKFSSRIRYTRTEPDPALALPADLAVSAALPPGTADGSSPRPGDWIAEVPLVAPRRHHRIDADAT